MKNIPPRPIVYYMLDRWAEPNDRWIRMTATILFWDHEGLYDARIEMHPVLITSDEVTEQMECHECVAMEAYTRTLERHGEE